MRTYPAEVKLMQTTEFRRSVQLKRHASVTTKEECRHLRKKENGLQFDPRTLAVGHVAAALSDSFRATRTSVTHPSFTTSELCTSRAKRKWANRIVSRHHDNRKWSPRRAVHSFVTGAPKCLALVTRTSTVPSISTASAATYPPSTTSATPGATETAGFTIPWAKTTVETGGAIVQVAAENHRPGATDEEGIEYSV